MLISAIEFAAEAHKFQKRKDIGQSAYINHPIEVMTILRKFGKVEDELILAAAVLHDTIEDTAITYAHIHEEFGIVVADYVQEVSDDKTLPKQRRKELQIETMSSKSDGAKLIKIADKISNLRSVAHNPPIDWDIERRRAYFEWSKQVVDQGRGVNATLDSLFDMVYTLRGLL